MRVNGISQKILFIAGHDPSGHAGLIADINMAYNCGFQSACVITALTTQNKTKFFKTNCVQKNIVKASIQALLPLNQFAAIKIGMLGNDSIIQTLIPYLKKYSGPIILDPVITASAGGTLLTPKGQKYLIQKLLPLVTIWTPNIPEALRFLNTDNTKSSQIEIANKLFKIYKKPVYLKGGHGQKHLIDIFYDGVQLIQLAEKRLSKKLRGTGCQLATLLACTLAANKTSEKILKQMRHRFQKYLEKL